MDLFPSDATEDRSVAATLNRALLEQGHEVSFDRDDLPAGDVAATAAGLRRGRTGAAAWYAPVARGVAAQFGEDGMPLTRHSWRPP